MNDDQRLIADTTERMLEAHCTNQLIDQAEKGVYPTKLWELLESNGLTSLGADTSLGGGGGSFGDALVVLRQAGRFAVPLPLAETLVATQVLGECGIQVQKGAALVAGAEPGSSGDLPGEVIGPCVALGFLWASELLIAAFLQRVLKFFRGMSSKQIQKWKKKYPNEINKMPIQASVFYHTGGLRP